MRNFTLFYIVAFFVFSLNAKLHAQIVISKPSFRTIITKACASASFNNFDARFTFSPESGLEVSNQFIVELSDGNGSFSNPTQIYVSNPGAITTSPVDFSFSLPTTTSGENYTMRVRSTAPNSISGSSNMFPAYYKIHDTDFSINNLIASAVYCSGGSYLLSIDNPNKFPGDSPIQYPNLTYNWYKETSETSSIFISEGETLSVNQPGTYFAETNYGSCTSESESNRVTLSEATTNSTTSINSSLGNPYCSTDGPTVLSAINANGYQWFKDDEVIPGATSQMYETNESGEYSVNIDLGSCMTSASINLDNTGFSSSINVDDINNIDEDETLIASITTTANNPEFKWYLNDNMINDATNSSYEITQTGNYKAVVTQTTGCNASIEFPFVVRDAFPNVEKIPNIISPNGDGANDTWVIPQKYVNGTNTEVVIISSMGKVEFKTNNYQNNWPENEIIFADVNPVYYYIITPANGKVKKGTITVIK
jgi:hypothetical protein